jgi:hypothetical protein
MSTSHTRLLRITRGRQQITGGSNPWYAFAKLHCPVSTYQSLLRQQRRKIAEEAARPRSVAQILNQAMDADP